jgi:hypothetical protein
VVGIFLNRIYYQEWFRVLVRINQRSIRYLEYRYGDGRVLLNGRVLCNHWHKLKEVPIIGIAMLVLFWYCLRWDRHCQSDAFQKVRVASFSPVSRFPWVSPCTFASPPL